MAPCTSLPLSSAGVSQGWGRRFSSSSPPVAVNTARLAIIAFSLSVKELFSSLISTLLPVWDGPATAPFTSTSSLTVGILLPTNAPDLSVLCLFTTKVYPSFESSSALASLSTSSNRLLPWLCSVFSATKKLKVSVLSTVPRSNSLSKEIHPFPKLDSLSCILSSSI